MSGDEAAAERVDVRIRGRVQGVYFRATARDEARRLGLSGWVKNEPDGAVRAVAEGPRSALESFVAWCHRGSAGAAVETVDATWSAAEGDLSGFQVRRTGEVE